MKALRSPAHGATQPGVGALVWRVLRIVGGVGRAFQLALPKLGVGWMFALLTVNYNRITIVELGITAALITTMLGLHHFLSPFQVIVGRYADSHPIWGFRRTPYLLASGLVASLVFVALPSVAVAMSGGSPGAIVAGFGLLIVFGICIAVAGDSHHALISEVTTARSRGGVISVVWTFTILSTIVTAIILRAAMPEYNPATMQAIYSATPFVVVGSALLGVLGVERRLRGTALTEALAKARAAAPVGNPLRVAVTVLRGNPQARSFFAFVFLSILGIFLQDNILEVFGGEVFGMGPGDTSRFQVVWGTGVLGSMIVMGVLSTIFPLSKKWLAALGGIGTALGLGLLALTALLGERALLNPALTVMGLSTGMFNVGALSLMMEMVVDGATGLYIGLWGIAQAFGQGAASISSGVLKTTLIETELLNVHLGFGLIFGLEMLIMVVAVAMLRGVNIQAFKGITRTDLNRAMELGATA
jgi:MFS transporter, BCD family, chlorophyll transporter